MKTFASLFSGGGGADVGASLAGWKPIWAIEIDPQIAEVYQANLGHRPITKSVTEVDPKSLERPDVLWASPPCQQWSSARSKNLPTRTDADLGLAVIPFLEILQPQVFILENVEGYRKAKPFKAIVDTLHRYGYWTQWSVLNTADFGVPQTRRRLILRAILGGFVPPLPAKQKWCGWYSAILDLIPTLPESQFPNWQRLRLPELNITSLIESRNTIRESTVRGFNEPAPCVTAHWMHRPSITPKALLIGDCNGGMPQEDGSLGLSIRHLKEPVFTIQASLDHKQALAWLEHGRIVAMTPRAVARFQSFPDSYQLPEKNTLACRVLGNAVPPLLAQKLLETINQVS